MGYGRLETVPMRPVGCSGWSLLLLAAVAFLPGIAAAQSPWLSTAKSTGQNPIEVARFGKGNQNILIVGALSGNEPASIELIDAACRMAATVAPPEEITLLFVRTPNPDGLRELMRTNARGVDLNRNFPSRQFTLIPNRLTGPRPASEVETQYMLRILEEYKPVRIIHVRSGVGETPLVLTNQSWQAKGATPVLPQHVSYGLFEETYKAGSLEEYAAREMNASVSTVILAAPGTKTKQLQADELLRFAIANLSRTSTPSATPDSNSEPLARTSPSATIIMEEGPAAPADVPPQTTSPQITSQATVELLSPPPEYLTTSRPNKNGDGNDSRYFELPPPPR